MLLAMLGDRMSRAARGPLLVLLLGGACKASPAEAPPPDASAWPDERFDPGPALDDAPEPAATATATEVAPPRPRPPRTIFRDEVERATGPGPAYLLRQLAPEPFRHDGRFVGWTITQLFPDDPRLCAERCDLAPGDVIVEVNGHRLQTPQDLSDALQALPGWARLRVVSLRGGKRRQVTYAIVDDPG